jgi:6-phosphogluconolactonase
MAHWFKMISKAQITIKDTPIDLARTAADILNMRADECFAKKDRFIVALSGGTTPRLFHRMLAQEPYISEIPWDKMRIFWVDERCVPENDVASNYGASKSDFLDRAPISKNQIYPMPGWLSPEDGARNYQKTLMEFFHLKSGQFPIFDQIFLGMGADGHIASLFPEHTSLDEKEKLVVAVKGGDPYVSRLTMTLPVLNRTRHIVFLVSGKGKAAALNRVFEGTQALLPAQKIRASEGDVTWLLDREASSLLPGEMIHE